jgi:hypothetical protein
MGRGRRPLQEGHGNFWKRELNAVEFLRLAVTFFGGVCIWVCSYNQRLLQNML